MAGERLARIRGLLTVAERDGKTVCEVAADAVGVSGAGVMLMSGDAPEGSLCSTNEVSRLIEELQYTLGEGPCVDAFRHGEVVAEPDLAGGGQTRWIGFSSRAVEGGARAVFGFPLRAGAARLGALNLYKDQPGGLSVDQHADALVMADVIAGWALDSQAGASPGALAAELERDGEFYFVVHNAAGAMSVQLGVSVGDALVRLRAYAFSEGRPLKDVAEDVVARRLRFS